MNEAYSVSTLHLLMLAALAVQFPLAGLGFVVEWNQRKKRPAAHREPLVSRRPAVERAALPTEEPTAPRVERPEPPAKPPSALSAPPLEPTAATRPESQIPPEPSTPSLEVAPLPVEVPEPAARKEELEPAAEAQRPAVVETQPEAEVPPPAEAPRQLLAEAPLKPQPRQPIAIGLGLRKTRESFLARIRAAITGSTRVDEIYEGLEEALISADVGVETSTKLVEGVRSKLKNDARADIIRDALKQEMAQALVSIERPLNDGSPLVIMMAGVNGAGKTTTVAKLAALLKAERGSVIVAASDTFRAAAIEQLQIWCDRVGVELIKQKQGSDPAAVAFDAVKAANARRAGAVIIDTAGRLQTKVNLMEELKKIARVVSREIPGAPHENWLVLDATTGQNALSQAKIFGEAVKLTGVILAKLDSTAKGGVIVAIAERLKLPVRYVGLGEELEDLRPFDAREFVEALFSETEDGRAEATKTYAA
jgi:fused signal recognition particle receptor